MVIVQYLDIKHTQLKAQNSWRQNGNLSINNQNKTIFFLIDLLQNTSFTKCKNQITPKNGLRHLPK